METVDLEQMKQFKVSKLDAAKRQLECAISLYFNEKDPVSIHTLTSASYNILRSLNKGRVWMSQDYLHEHIVPGKEKFARELFRKPENFFKHADRDPEEILDFNPDGTEIPLFEACQVYRGLTGEAPEKMVAYNIWFKAKYDRVFIYTPEERANMDRARDSMHNLSRRTYFEMMLQALSRISH